MPAAPPHLVPRLALALALAGCGSGDGPASAPAPVASTETVDQLGPAAFAAAVAEPGRVTVNVHVPDEGRIAGTDLVLPYDQVRARTAELPADRTTPLAVYCRTGRMSAEAVAVLTELGYTDVVELAGGMQAWQSAGRPLQP